MNSTPRITVVTPSFNQGHLIEETICSVLDQNYPNLEYVVVDGGSTDDTVEVLRKYDRHITWWVSEKDDGQAHAINKGLAKATGQIHAYLNSDDRYAPDALRIAAERFMAGCPWIIGAVRNFGEGWVDQVIRYEAEQSPEDQFKWFFQNPIHQPGTFWSADLTRRFGAFDESLHYVFDYDFFMRLRFRGRLHPYPVDAVLAEFRLHSDSKTVSLGWKRFEPEFERVRLAFVDELPPDDRPRALRELRRWQSNWLQVMALVSTSNGNRAEALSHWMRSLAIYPRIALERRTPGCLKRILMGAKMPPYMRVEG